MNLKLWFSKVKRRRNRSKTKFAPSRHISRRLYRTRKIEQANSENCGPPLGNKFDLEVGQRSPSRSRHWYHQKGLVTKNTHAKYQIPTCKIAKVMAKVKVFVKDGRTDRQTDGTNEI